MNCTQVQEQLIDFLYGELPAEARKAFTEHLNGCPACKAEVAGYQHTLGSARAALGGPLLEEAPARVHLAVIEAAKAAAKQQATPAKVKQPSSRDELGFFARLWRAPWLLPAFGAASIATVVFLVRVLKNPEVLPGQRPHSIEERSVVTPEPVLPPETVLAPQASSASAAQGKAAPASKSDLGKGMVRARGPSKQAADKVAAPAEAPAVRSKSKKALTDSPLDGLNLSGAPSSAGGLGRFAEPPPPRPATAKAHKDLDDLLSESPRQRQPAPAVGEAEHARDGADRREGLVEKVARPAQKAPQNESAAELAKPTARAAVAPAGAAASAPAYAPAPAATPAAPRMRDYPAESAASAPAAAPTSNVKRKAGRQSDEEAKGSVVVTDDDWAEETYDKKARSGDKTGPSLDESVRKAERLYASQDWNAAAAAYRDLLNRFPSYKDAPRWRDRMNQSLVAEEQRQAKLKKAKAKTTDVLDGLKL